MKIEIEKITALRHELHRFPELSLCESMTKQRLMNFIKRETDLEVTDCGKWFYALYWSPKEHAQSIAFRADFDALAIPETDGLPYCSANSGVSHKCGHDGHSAVLCGFAMAANRYGADKNIYFIFQHAEEIGAGGRECASLIREKQIVYLKEPFRSSEDFGYYQKQCPGVMFYIGNGEAYPQIHTAEYDFNDNIIETAIEMFAALGGVYLPA